MLRAHHVSVHTGVEQVLDEVSLEVADHARIGLVGPNGSGKTTLLRVLAGRLHPQGGTVVATPGLRIGWQRQTPPDPGRTVGKLLAEAAAPVAGTYAALLASQQELARAAVDQPGDPGDDRAASSVRAASDRLVSAEDAFASAGGWAGLARQDEVRSRLGVGTEGGIHELRTIGSLSGGEAARVALACLLLQDPDVLLLDEPTNHLDLDGRRWLAAYLREFAGAVVVASHDRAFLDRTVTRIVELDDLTAGLEDYPGGGWTAYRLERARRWERMRLDLEAQEKFRERVRARIEASKPRSAAHEAANPRNPGARRVARMVARRAVVRERRLTRLMESASWVSAPRHRPVLRLERGGEVGPSRTVRLAGLPVTAGERTITHVDLQLGTHERIWLTGANGSGKTSLLRALRPHVPGTVLLDQHDGLPRNAGTAVEVLRSAVPMYAADAEELLAAYGFDEGDWSRPVSRLSPGQVRRLGLAVALNTPATMLVLDEPTNHLDVDTVEALEEVLRGFPGGLIVVTHDERFADAIGLETRWDLEADRQGVRLVVGQSSPR